MDLKQTLNETLTARFEGEWETVEDIVNHGMEGGVSDFTYTNEINEFFNEFECELEDYYHEIFGDEWLSHVIDNATTFDEVRCRMVWGYVEQWCNTKLDEALDEVSIAGDPDNNRTSGLAWALGV